MLELQLLFIGVSFLNAGIMALAMHSLIQFTYSYNSIFCFGITFFISLLFSML